MHGATRNHCPNHKTDTLTSNANRLGSPRRPVEVLWVAYQVAIKGRLDPLDEPLVRSLLRGP